MLWRFRNEVVHGSTVAEQVTLQLNKLKEKITGYYQAYSVTPSIILARHQYLFTTHTVAEWISGSYDSMAAWIRSV
jgi:nitrogen fixation/metabolism regulation signal transduction histidine kinase